MNRDEKELEVIKEKISYYKELLRNLTLLLIATTGGTAGLLFKLNNPIAVLLVFPGIIFSSGIFISIFAVLDSLRTEIKEIERWKKR